MWWLQGRGRTGRASAGRGRTVSLPLYLQVQKGCATSTYLEFRSGHSCSKFISYLLITWVADLRIHYRRVYTNGDKSPEQNDPTTWCPSVGNSLKMPWGGRGEQQQWLVFLDLWLGNQTNIFCVCLFATEQREGQRVCFSFEEIFVRWKIWSRDVMATYPRRASISGARTGSSRRSCPRSSRPMACRRRPQSDQWTASTPPGCLTGLSHSGKETSRE